MARGWSSCWRRRRPSSKAEDCVPFPTRQLFILGKDIRYHQPCDVWKSELANWPTALCRLGEPIAFTSIFPYIYYMILSFNISNDERQVAMYAGMVTSAFAFAEFSAGAFWGSLSDKVGRKPILLTGLAGTGISMLAFGFSTSLPMAIIARALGGILNGFVSNHRVDLVESGLTWIVIEILAC
jgi:MFS family permease